MHIYCMADIHGCLDAFERAVGLVLPHMIEPDTQLVLLGDYIHRGSASYAVLDRVMGLQQQWGTERVVALRGNHEQLVLDGFLPIAAASEPHKREERTYRAWMQHLPYYYIADQVIFVHAGIDEEAGELWQVASDEYMFLEKYPAQTGAFLDGWKIVAGHIGTSQLVGDPSFHDVFYDGEAHYYIDGNVEVSGSIPVLFCDTQTGEAHQVSAA